MRLMCPIIRDNDRSVFMIMDFRVFFKLGFVRPHRLARLTVPEALHLHAGGIDTAVGGACEILKLKIVSVNNLTELVLIFALDGLLNERKHMAFLLALLARNLGMKKAACFINKLLRSR